MHEIQWSLNSECIQSSDDLQCSETANSHYTASIFINVLQLSKYLLHLQAIIYIDDNQIVSYFLKLSVADIGKLIWSYVWVVDNFHVCVAR